MVIKIIVITIIVIIIIIIIIDRKYCRDLYAVFTESPSLNEDLKFEE